MVYINNTTTYLLFQFSFSSLSLITSVKYGSKYFVSSSYLVHCDFGKMVLDTDKLRALKIR